MIRYIGRALKHASQLSGSAQANRLNNPEQTTLLGVAAFGNPFSFGQLMQAARTAASLGVMQRGYATVPAGLELPVFTKNRREKFAEVPLVSELLPNRRAFTLQFSPHGIQLVPRAILPPMGVDLSPPQPTQASQQSFDVVKDSVEQDDHEQTETSIQAISTKTWRRLKMKKHKIRKRRRASRMKVSRP